MIRQRNVAKIMEGVGIPGKDAYELKSSELRFPDGAHCRIEIAGVERISTFEKLLEEKQRCNVPVHRLISMVMGSTYVLKDELKAYAKLARDEKIEVVIAPGTRAIWEPGTKQLSTPDGLMSGTNIRGADYVNYLLRDVYRCLDLGFRGFLVMDIVILDLLNELKVKGDFPEDTFFKMSNIAGCGNPCNARLMDRLGSASVNPLIDVSLPQLATIRLVTKLPMDVFVVAQDSTGGLNRMWECSEVARVCAPAYLKFEPGPSFTTMYKPWMEKFNTDFIVEKVRMAKIITEMIESVDSGIVVSKQGPDDLTLPAA